MTNIDKSKHPNLYLSAMKPTHEPAINVSFFLALEDSTNMQGTSSNIEDVNLSHDDLVDHNTQTEVNVKDVNYYTRNFHSKCRRVVS